MLPPHELKNKTFSKSMRGYNPVEVDEYIEFLIEKYTELYRENDELERKLKAAVTHLEEIRDDEDSIRGALIDAKRAASNIRAEAEERAEAIVRSAKSSCNTILADFNTKIEEGRSTLIELNRDALRLKRELFEKYSEHIKYLDRLTDGIDEASVPDTDTLRREAVTSLKKSISDAYSTKTSQSAEAAPAAETSPSEAENASPADNANGQADAQNYAAQDGADENAYDAQDNGYADESAYDNTETSPEEDYSEPAEDLHAEDETIVFTPAKEPAPENAPAFADDDFSKKDGEGLEIKREPLKTGKPSLKDSIKELNRRYREEDDVINTPDSDVDDEGYLDFVKSVTGGRDDGRDPKKDKEFDMLFSDEKKKK